MSLNTLKSRVAYMGGDNIGRIKRQKLNSFHAALQNDYNSRPICTPTGKHTRVLMNNSNLKSDYDKKIVSADFREGLQPGDVYECLDDNTHWMIYLPDLCEVSYLKAEIIRCRYQLTINDTDYWIYFQGPTETALRWNLKDGLNWNDLNFSGTIYIKRTDDTVNFFDRFTKLKIDGHTWQVKVVDIITVPGIIELEIDEYFDSITEDLIEVYKADDITDDTIIGRTTVDVNSIAGYQIAAALFNDTDSWTVLNNDKVTIQETQANGQTCIVKIAEDAEGSFDLRYGDNTIHIEIEKPVTMIQGESTVYPYGSYTYTAQTMGGTFSVNSTLAQITSQDNGTCGIEITTGRSGSFTLTYTLNETEYSLLITILPL